MKRKMAIKKALVRALSLFLCVLTVFFATPSVIYAEVADAIGNIGNNEASSDESDVYSYTGAAYEVEELREERVKHFHLEDGSFVAAQYDFPVHYEDEDGVLQDINNRLTESSGIYASESGRIKFSKKINGSQTLFTLHDGSTKLTLNLI
ncbi:MAG: hypothetical protein IJY65_04870, partial [Clostridia bacterium]|nr:hypothetical protein [Clostridia bacterium]